MKKIIVLLLAGMLSLGAHFAYSSAKAVKAANEKISVQLKLIDEI